MNKPKFTKKVAPVADKKKLIALIRETLKKTDLPSTIQLEKWAVITDVQKFFESHLVLIEHNEGLYIKPASERLKKALGLIGIDIKELAKQIIDADNN